MSFILTDMAMRSRRNTTSPLLRRATMHDLRNDVLSAPRFGSLRQRLGFPLEREMEMPLLACIERMGGVICFSSQGERLERELADHFGLSKESREYSDPTRLRSKGARAWRNQIQWVRNRLVRKGLLSNTFRGLWIVTPAGKRALGQLG